MFIKSIKPIGYLLSAIFMCYLIHKAIFSFFNYKINLNILNFSVEKLYLLFSTASIIIVLILIKIKQKNIDLVGNVFLLVTGLKFFVFLILIKSSIENFNHSFEKYNFLIIFLLFLALETTATIFILNEK